MAGREWEVAITPHRRPVLDTGLGFSFSRAGAILSACRRAARSASWRTASAIEGAIAREKLVKKWQREWKFALIEADNPDWDDLWDQWFKVDPSAK